MRISGPLACRLPHVEHVHVPPSKTFTITKVHMCILVTEFNKFYYSAEAETGNRRYDDEERLSYVTHNFPFMYCFELRKDYK